MIFLMELIAQHLFSSYVKSYNEKDHRGTLEFIESHQPPCTKFILLIHSILVIIFLQFFEFGNCYCMHFY